MPGRYAGVRGSGREKTDPLLVDAAIRGQQVAVIHAKRGSTHVRQTAAGFFYEWGSGGQIP